MLALGGVLVMAVDDRELRHDILNIQLKFHMKLESQCIESLTKCFITSHYYVCVNEEHKVTFAISRIFFHQVLLRYYSPVLWVHLREIGIEPEIYVWDWFVQCFMGIFTLDQCYVILDLLFSLQFNDHILICLSIAILDELKPILLIVHIQIAF